MKTLSRIKELNEKIHDQEERHKTLSHDLRNGLVVLIHMMHGASELFAAMAKRLENLVEFLKLESDGKTEKNKGRQ